MNKEIRVKPIYAAIFFIIMFMYILYSTFIIGARTSCEQSDGILAVYGFGSFMCYDKESIENAEKAVRQYENERLPDLGIKLNLTRGYE